MENVFVIVYSELTTLWGIALYWAPLIMCSVGYLLRAISDVHKDVVARSAPINEFGLSYEPSITVGTLIGRGLVSIIPVANLLAAIFDVAPEVFGNFFKTLGKIFNQPLVAKRPISPAVQPTNKEGNHD
jgi:hypothetical protein